MRHAAPLKRGSLFAAAERSAAAFADAFLSGVIRMLNNRNKASFEVFYE
jgi:hypothetical protein